MESEVDLESIWKYRTTMENECVSCNNEVAGDHRAILCDLYESWEHVDYIRSSDRPTEALYEAMVSSRTKALIFSFSSCRKREPITKRLLQHEFDSARAESERLASARLLDEREQSISSLKVELSELKGEIETLRKQLLRSVQVKQELVTLISTGMVMDVTSEVVKNKPMLSPHHDELLKDRNTSSSSTSSQSSGEHDESDNRSQGRQKTHSH